MGLGYINSSGQESAAKKLKCTCREGCPLECSLNFNTDVRTKIHKSFWIKPEIEKRCFFAKFVKRQQPKRKRKIGESRRSFTFLYYFQLNGKLLQVCRTFFENTLDIKAGKVHYYFNHYHDDVTGKPKPYVTNRKKSLQNLP